ncbi:sulfotransferase domain-containing protein [bacterium]|nr:sulfotransferase domain-containing protein [bacterium]
MKAIARRKRLINGRRPRPQPIKNNSPSYEAAMEKFKMFISYPRSGSNWVNCVMELYFDRPRLRRGANTFMRNKKKRHDFLWFHDHDIFSKLKLRHENYIYLYRDPINVIYSLLKAEHKIEQPYAEKTDALVAKQIGLLREHYKKYLLDDKKCKVIIRYEDLKNNHDEFEKFIKFMHPKTKEFDKEKLADAIKKVTKEGLAKSEPDKRYFNKNMLTDKYEEDRAKFTEKYAERINSELITDELKRFFE